MMVKAATWLLATVLLVAVSSPRTAGSSDFMLTYDLDNVYEFRGDGTVVRPRAKIIRQIYRLAMETFRRPHHEAVQFAEAIAAKPHPSILAGVCAQEGRFDPEAPVTWGGCRGAYQVCPGDYGPVPCDIAGQTAQASRALEEKLKEQRGRIVQGLRAYNGDPASAATAPYPAKVMAWRKKLLSSKI